MMCMCLACLCVRVSRVSRVYVFVDMCVHMHVSLCVWGGRSGCVVVLMLIIVLAVVIATIFIIAERIEKNETNGE